MAVAVVRRLVIEFRTAANIDCFLVKLVHVVEEREVVVSELVVGIESGALFKVVDCLTILFLLEV